MNKSTTKLSQYEQKVYDLKNKNMANKEVALKLKKTNAQISQTINRIKLKGHTVKCDRMSNSMGLTRYQNDIYEYRLKDMSSSDIASKLNKTVPQIDATLNAIKNKGINISPRNVKQSKKPNIHTIKETSEWGSIDKGILYGKNKHNLKIHGNNGKMKAHTPIVPSDSSTQNFSEYEKKVYGYILSGMTTSEIANAMNKTTGQIRNTKYRINKKGFCKSTNDKMPKHEQQEIQNEDNPFIVKSLTQDNNTLSARELEISSLLFTGTKPKAIGVKLNISAKTVATYKYRIFRKLGVKNLVEFVHVGNKYGLEPITDIPDESDGSENKYGSEASDIAMEHKYTIIIKDKVLHTVNMDAIVFNTKCSEYVISHYIRTNGLPFSITNCDIYLSKDYNDTIRHGEPIPVPPTVPSRIIGDYFVEEMSTGNVFKEQTLCDLKELSVDIELLENMVQMYGYPVKVFDFVIHNRNTFEKFFHDFDETKNVEDKPQATREEKKQSFLMRWFGSM